MMLLRSIILFTFIFAAQTASSETWQTDAFGVYDGEDHLREKWAGHKELCSAKNLPMTCTDKFVASGELASLELFLGQKSSTAGTGELMAATILHDKFGNLVQTPTQLDFHFQTGLINERSFSNMGRAFRKIDVPQKAGQFTAHVNAKEINSIKKFYRINTDITTLSVILPQYKYELFENQSTKIESFGARDRYGNYPVIGVQAQAILSSKDGSYIALPILSNGEKFKTKFPAPATRGEAKGMITLGAKDTAQMQLNVKALKLSPSVQLAGINFFKDGIVEILISNIGDTNGALLTDGTEFMLELHSSKGSRKLGKTYLLDGKIHTIFAVSQMEYPVNIIGKSHYGSFELKISGDEDLPLQLISHEGRS